VALFAVHLVTVSGALMWVFHHHLPIPLVLKTFSNSRKDKTAEGLGYIWRVPQRDPEAGLPSEALGLSLP